MVVYFCMNLGDNVTYAMYNQMGREVLEGLRVSQSQQRPLSRGKSTNRSLPISFHAMYSLGRQVSE